MSCDGPSAPPRAGVSPVLDRPDFLTGMNPDAPEMQVSGDREGVEFVNISTSNSSFEKINTGRRLENSTGRPGGSVSGGGRRGGVSPSSGRQR